MAPLVNLQIADPSGHDDIVAAVRAKGRQFGREAA